jgi:DNA-binding transcriptional MerR regulator
LIERYYRVGEFAKIAGVTIRTLQFYDHKGLLPPSSLSESGQRLYCDNDLFVLQQILALKALGLSLVEIKSYLRKDASQLASVLDAQKNIINQKRRNLDAILRAIEEVESTIQENHFTWDGMIKMMEVINMDQKNDWVNKYLSSEDQKLMNEISDKSYSEEARQMLASRGPWTEADQQRVNQEYASLANDLKRLVQAGEDPASPGAQAAAAKFLGLINQFTQGDPQVEAGLKQWWQNFDQSPVANKPNLLPWGPEEGKFLDQAVQIFQQHK